MHLKTSGNTQKNKWLYANKTFLIMKLIVFFVFVCCFQVKATNGQQVTLNTKNTSLRHIFNEIERQTGYHFFYKDKLLTSQKTSVSVQNVSLTEALYESMDHLPLTFSIIDKTIIIKESDEKPAPEFIRTPLVTALFEEIKGVVTDGDGIPLQGVSIVVRGTTRGTSTGADGAFTINANRGDWLEFSMVGYTPKGLQIGVSTRLNVELERVAATGLDEVVVTALGISREKKSLGYASQQISGDEVNSASTGNITDALSGKVSGVQIKKSLNFGGSTNIIIRGFKSLTGNNQALWVVDGVPVDNSNWNTVNQKNSSYGYDYGNMAADINQEDIESINILKGAAATALYGARAANGAVIVTTKSGTRNHKTSVTIDSRLLSGSMDKSTFPDYQREYGGGYGPVFGPLANDYFNHVDIDKDGVLDLVAPNPNYASYGAPYESQPVFDWYSLDVGSPRYLKPNEWKFAENGPSSFYETPLTNVNSVSVAGSGSSSNFRFSYTRYDEKGILPNSKINRNSVSFKTSNKVHEKVTVSGEANYIGAKSLGRNMTGGVGGVGNNVAGVFRQYWQLNADVQKLKEMYFNTRRNVSNFVGGTIDNVYWLRYEVFSQDRRDRFFGNVSVAYNIKDWVNFVGRVSIDNYSFLMEEMRNNGSIKLGYYGRNNITFQEVNYDLMINFNKNLTTKLNLAGVVGGNIRRNKRQSIFNETNGGLVVTGLYSIANSKDQPSPSQESLDEIGVNGIFALLSFGYDNLLFLDLTGRNDISSTLPRGNNSYFYPSASASFLFSQLLNSKLVSYGKLRVNFASVGNDAPPHSLDDVLIKPIPFGSVQMYELSKTKNNANLKSEKTNSVEVGLETKFFNNTIGAELTVYKTNTRNQIMPVLISSTTGYLSRFVNAGNIENKGVEISINANPIRTKNFNWSMNINWSKNNNKVISLFEGVENLVLGYRSGFITAEVGKPYGTIVGRDYVYKDGQKVVDQKTGIYRRTNESNIVLGNMNPDWIGGFRNVFKYKDFSFSFLIDMQKGGDIFSQDLAFGIGRGLYNNNTGLNDLGNPMRNTLANGGGIILDGVDEHGTKNQVRTDMSVYTSALSEAKAPDAMFIYDASYVKLRELSISYLLPLPEVLKHRIKTIALTLTGQNLWIIHKNIPYSDPEAGTSSGNLQGFQQGVLPAFRQYGVGINLQF